MTTSKTVTLTRTFKARPERVFAAFENLAETARRGGMRRRKTEVKTQDVRDGDAVWLNRLQELVEAA
jgi:uncharacterized protein YndB with AHSA1/START domain